MFRVFAALLIVQCVVLAGCSRAVRHEPVPPTDTRYYNIRPFLLVPPQFGEAPEMDLNQVTQARSGGALFSTAEPGSSYASPARAELIEQIMQLIKTTVDPDNWRDAGGLVSGMSEFNGYLIIHTTPANHERIAEVLQSYETMRGQLLAVEAKFLLMPSALLETLGTPAAGPLILDKAAAAKLMASSTTGQGNVRVVGTARMMMFDSQRVFATSIRQRAFVQWVKDETPAPDGDRKAQAPEPRRKPIVALVDTGNVVDVEAVVDGQGKSVLITIRAQMADVLDSVAADKQEGEQPLRGASSWRVSASVPDGGAVLMASSVNDKRAGAVEDGAELVLMVRVTVVK